MCQFRIICDFILVAVLAGARCAVSQMGAGTIQNAQPYRLSVPVDEVSLTFHAADRHKLPVNDLKLDELSLFDNDKPPGKILVFQSTQDFPIRAGILMDTSGSMAGHLAGDRAISMQYAQHLLRQQTDQAFVMDFGYISNILQPWTSDPAALTTGIQRIRAGAENPRGGTALLDAVYRVCLYEFGKMNHAASGNFILLFSDGEDNASHTSLRDAVDICQRNGTAVYAFRAESDSGPFSTGPETLAKLTSETGGRIFHDDGSAAEINTDLRIIEGDLRNQYYLVYKPAKLKHNGAFHHIALIGPDRVDSIAVRSGYYAPEQ
jgi:Ca-activated chloride channel family protein